MEAILNAQNIEKHYGQEHVLKGISLSIMPNTFTAILGHSGSGKSTLLNVLSGLTQPGSGKVIYKNKTITDFSEKQIAEWKRMEVGHVFQNYLLLNNLTAGENIRIGIAPGRTPLAFDRMTRVLNIEDILNKFPGQLSGGQQQRVAIARAVMKSPDLLFCDEATGSLDEANSKEVLRLLHDLKSTFGVTILFTTHNRQIAATADRILTIKDGKIYNDEMNNHPISADDMVWG